MADRDERNRAASEARELDLNSPGFLEHEFESYRVLREQLPIARAEKLGPVAGTAGGAWFLTRYDDVAQVLRDPERFSSEAKIAPIRPWIPQQVDPPAQTSYRRILNARFTPAAASELEPRILEHAEQLVDAMLAQDEFEFVSSFADPFPTVIFCELMGFPTQDHERLMDWKNALMHNSDGHVRGREVAKEMLRALDVDLEEGQPLPPDAVLKLQVDVVTQLYAYFARLLDERRAEPRDDLITALLEARYDDERPLSQEELEDYMLLLFMGGLDTVASTLGLVVRHFAEHPSERREFASLMEDPERVADAIEELVRFHAIVTPPRRLTRDLAFHGALFRRDDTVLCSTPAANHDPDQFPEPERLRFDRHPNRHLGFGLGPHRCLGIHLARRELRIGLQVLHRRLPDYRLHPQRPPLAFGGMKGMGSLWLVKG